MHLIMIGPSQHDIMSGGRQRLMVKKESDDMLMFREERLFSVISAVGCRGHWDTGRLDARWNTEARIEGSHRSREYIPRHTMNLLDE